MFDIKFGTLKVIEKEVANGPNRFVDFAWTDPSEGHQERSIVVAV